MEYENDNNKNVFSENKAFLIPCLVVWITGAVILAIYDKVSHIQIWANGFYSPWQNDIWMTVTDMGDTFFFLAVFFIGSLLSYRFSLYLSVTGVVMVVSSTLLKYLFVHPLSAYRIGGDELVGEHKHRPRICNEMLQQLSFRTYGYRFRSFFARVRFSCATVYSNLRPSCLPWQ